MLVRDVVDKVVGWLDKFKAIGDIVVSSDPIHAALPWAAFRFLLMAAGQDSARMGAVLVILETVIGILGRCEIYEGLYLKGVRFAPVFENLERSLVVLYAAILSLLAKSKKFFETRTAGMIRSQIKFV